MCVLLYYEQINGDRDKKIGILITFIMENVYINLCLLCLFVFELGAHT